MPDYQAARIRVSIDTTLDVRERFNEAIPQGIRGKLLTEVLQQITEIAEKPDGLHYIIDVVNGKIKPFKAFCHISTEEMEAIAAKMKRETSKESI